MEYMETKRPATKKSEPSVSLFVFPHGGTMPFAELESHHITLLAGVGLFLLVMINRIRRSFNRSTRPGPRRSPRGNESPRRPRLPTVPANRQCDFVRLSASTEQEDWEVEMHDLARS